MGIRILWDITRSSFLQVSDNVWHHVALVKYATVMKLYVDCILIETEPITGTFVL